MNSVTLFFAWLLIACAPPSISFETDVLPILTKAGCNTGACHGAAAGRGGLRLSLFASGPEADFAAIVHAMEGRRVNVQKPEASLIFRKPAGYLDHGGSVVFAEDSSEANTLLEWIRQGAARGPVRRVTRLQVMPAGHLCRQLPETVPMRITADFSDGTTEDVTARARIVSADTSAISVNMDESLTVHRAGQHLVIVRFLNSVVPVRIRAPYGNAVEVPASEALANPIDVHIRQVLSEMGIPRSSPASDSEWLRRVSLDLTGRLPTPAEMHSFLANSASDKRSVMVESLLAGTSFVDLWTLRFAQLLRLRSLPNERQAFEAGVDWLRDVVQNDRRFDDLARQLITATGDSHLIGPAGWSRMAPDARSHAEMIGDVFAGARLGCANCHNHPLDRWTQDDYHGLAAVFAKLDRSRVVAVLERGAVTNVRTGEPAIPRIPGLRDLSVEGDQREQIADWVLAEPELLFARATVNRLWMHMFGRGLVDPVNDLRETNPATHPELLQWLTEDFAEHGYRIRHTLRQIALSEAYAAGSHIMPGNAVDDRFYSRSWRRPLSGEVLLDALADVTGVPGQYTEHDTDLAVQVIDSARPAESLDLLGRCRAGGECVSENVQAGGLPARLHLLNGDVINARLRNGGGRLKHMIAEGRTDAEIVTDFYVRGLGRMPDAGELQLWEERLRGEDGLQKGQLLEDFVWALLNSRDFLENH